MYLSKVKLFGFKSFARKAEIVFDDGITCVVGPNGCGKTNIVDAIRWVLGEQKISNLRGERMENVIFNGSADKKPLGMAEVGIVIKDNKEILQLDYSEVEIKRRMYRYGESEYFLNNVQCRLKDITNLFMDTGMGADAYSVIELKMVEQILSDKLEDRRRLFEEASGITKYKKRRSETFKKLEDTRQDLLRVNDIIIEVERKVNSLKRQAAKVRRYQKIKTELRIKENEIYRSWLYNVKSKKQPLIESINKLKILQDSSEGELVKDEAGLEKLRADMVILDNNLSEVQNEYNNAIDVLNNEQMELAIAKEKVNALYENIRKTESEETEINTKITENEIKMEENKERLNILAEKINDLKTKQKISEEELNRFYKEYYEKKNRLSVAQTKIVALIEKYAEKSRKQDKILSDLRQREDKISSIVKESKWIKERLLNKEKILQSLITERKKIEDFLSVKKSESQKMQNDVEAKKIMVNDLKEKIINLKNLIEIDNKKVEFLHQIISEKGKSSEGSEFLLKMKDSVDGLIGRVSELINTEKKYQKAIMAALNQTSNFLVFDTSENAFKAIKLITEKTSGEVDIIPLDKISNININVQEREKFSGDRIVGWANDFVKCNKNVKMLADFLLYDVLITKDSIIEKGFDENARNNGVSVVDLSGMMIDRQGFVHSIGDIKHSEVNVKLSEIEKTKTKIEQAKKGIEESEKIKADYLSQIEDITEKMNLTGFEIRDSEKRLREIENETSVCDYDVKKNREQLGKMEKERKQLEIFEVDKEVFERQKAELKMLKNEQVRLQVEIEKLKLQEEQLEQKRKILENSVYDKNLGLIKFQEELKRIEMDFKGSVELDKEYKRKITLGKESILKTNEEIRDWGKRIENSQNKINESVITKNNFEERIDNIRAQQVNLKNDIFEEEKRLKEKRNQRDNRANDIFESEIKLSGLQQEEKMLMEKIGDVGVEVSEDDKLDETEIEIKRRGIEALEKKLDSLGQINFAAVDEYQEEKERYDNFIQQRNDIVEAEKTLLETIQKINKIACEKFVETFEKIRINFKSIYSKFFENGDADLLLSDESNPLESKIMIVSKPFGKKLQSISLLSAGEKALTAIALLMGIYRVKPSPFCILDEVDAPLDDSNIERFVNVLKLFSKNTQFIVVTHNKKTMESAKYIYGVTMEENGVSKIVSTKFV
ncbi:MAG: chromosome segregation protein SMC [Candidatus Helarchaeota archaeon]|nr:chromosome segregation protein SMC [Candidatus Helarchaeota archaeon]